ncbi:hypothetical protein MKX31_10210 [Bacillus sp. FSL M8-0063]|uniref:Uncharacterized protein n=1 Tax=Bacillus thuringiensis TaxID=1428 RepID=A0A1C4DML4_BACTU|nr:MULTISPECIES: hypothetical protein [Bacillus]MBY7112649.1 hypothetical protein [Bacillus sp. 17RED48]MBY7124429.1 hypothetical protein [Bacillus sp. 16GRE42]MCC2323782.1 hypothetical protein [Bacillus wiedmannii]MCR6847106.1 hypothetical protein [Bacillus sp. IBL03825]MCU5115322.1 hypothetical protein [Bacillus wiedmannii]
MFCLEIIIGSVLGSFATCGLLYFGFRAEENKIAVMQKIMMEIKFNTICL